MESRTLVQCLRCRIWYYGKIFRFLYLIPTTRIVQNQIPWPTLVIAHDKRKKIDCVGILNAASYAKSREIRSL